MLPCSAAARSPSQAKRSPRWCIFSVAPVSSLASHPLHLHLFLPQNLLNLGGEFATLLVDGRQPAIGSEHARDQVNLTVTKAMLCSWLPPLSQRCLAHQCCSAEESQLKGICAWPRKESCPFIHAFTALD